MDFFCFLKSVAFSDSYEIKLSFPDLMLLYSGPRVVLESSLFSGICLLLALPSLKRCS